MNTKQDSVISSYAATQIIIRNTRESLTSEDLAGSATGGWAWTRSDGQTFVVTPDGAFLII
ncbi:MAG: hypothetical protein ACTSX8_02485 [Alphaproteobacteria bacterium]